MKINNRLSTAGLLVLLYCFVVPAVATHPPPPPCGDCEHRYYGNCVSDCNGSEVCCNDSCCGGDCCEGNCLDCDPNESCCGSICCGDVCCDDVCCDPNDTCCGDICCGGECEDCNDGICEDDDSKCGECYDCNDGSCVSCKCWDVNDAISGSITVQDAVLCQQKTHTSSISDTDYWIQGGGGSGTPSDSITSYSWSKSAGTWKSDTNEASVDWQAPACTGTVTITLTADDEPLSMDNPCPDSTRDDDPNDFNDTSTVSLPSGCSNAGAHDSSIHWNDSQNYSGSIYWGFCLTGPVNPDPDVDFKYNSCTWECEISNVEVSTFVQVGATGCSGYVDITQASDVPCADANLAKSDLYDPNLNDDVGAPNTKYWIHSAIVAHEEKHRSDWKTFYGQRLAYAISLCESFFVSIDCEIEYTHTCQGALGYWNEVIEETFDEAKTLAEWDNDNPNTDLDEAQQRALLAESIINHPVSNALPAGCTP